MDVVENQQYITKWVEDNIINSVKNTRSYIRINYKPVEDTIQTGVKDTQDGFSLHEYRAEEIIQNGVKHTMWSNDYDDVEDTIQNGIKGTKTPIDGCLTSTIEWKDRNTK